MMLFPSSVYLDKTLDKKVRIKDHIKSSLFLYLHSTGSIRTQNKRS